jgi:hypothetical protein
MAATYLAYPIVGYVSMWIDLKEKDVRLLVALLKSDCRRLLPNKKGTGDKWKLAARLALIGINLEEELRTHQRGIN